MSRVWRPQNPDVLKEWVETIMNEASDSLSDWESRFVEDMEKRLQRGNILTQSQEEKLEQIYADKTS